MAAARAERRAVAAGGGRTLERVADEPNVASRALGRRAVRLAVGEREGEHLVSGRVVKGGEEERRRRADHLLAVADVRSSPPATTAGRAARSELRPAGRRTRAARRQRGAARPPRRASAAPPPPSASAASASTTTATSYTKMSATPGSTAARRRASPGEVERHAPAPRPVRRREIEQLLLAADGREERAASACGGEFGSETSATGSTFIAEDPPPAVSTSTARPARPPARASPARVLRTDIYADGPRRANFAARVVAASSRRTARRRIHVCGSLTRYSTRRRPAAAADAWRGVLLMHKFTRSRTARRRRTGSARPRATRRRTPSPPLAASCRPRAG